MLRPLTSTAHDLQGYGVCNLPRVLITPIAPERPIARLVNGSHNQPAGPNLEPSHIYHFKGKVARCSTFTGMGTDNQGNRIAFGSPTTDYGVMFGDYWAARTTQHGTLTHI